MIGRQYDMDNQFFRMVTIALARTLNKSIRWINYFEPLNDTDTGRRRVLVPFYTSLTGDERFCFDAFVDDVVDARVTMNTDQFQRGMIQWNGVGSRSSEFANPNQYLAQKVNINGALKKVISKVKAVPLVLNYDIEIQLATENEVSKCSQKILSLLYNYMFFNIDYFGIKIDAVLQLPDDKTVEIPREVSMDSDRKKMIKFSLEVQTYFPIFKIDADDLITCDNDGDIDWDYMGIPQPTDDFLDSLGSYNESFGNVGIDGTPDGSGSTNTDSVGMSEIKRVYWEKYLHQLTTQQKVVDDRGPDPKTWKKETFDINPVDTSGSVPDNDID